MAGFSAGRSLHLSLFRCALAYARAGCEVSQQAWDIQPATYNKCYARFICLQSGPSAGSLCNQTSTHFNWVQYRQKSKKARTSSIDNDDYDSDESEEEDEGDKSKDFKIIKGHVNSTRIDAVLKVALGMSRNKVDNVFYSNSIYINGEKLDKKSHTLTVDDEVDVVRELNALNPAFLDVQRVEVLDVRRSRSNPDKLALKVRRFKRLTVDNYTSPWRPAASE